MTPDGLPREWFPTLPPDGGEGERQEKARIEETITAAKNKGQIDNLAASGWRLRLRADFHKASSELAKVKSRGPVGS